MNKEIAIEEILQSEGMYVSTTSGVSMYPMLRDRRDTIVIKPVNGRLKKYDIPLYRRGDSYVLHRIIKVLPESGYNIRGDNCTLTEKNVPESCIIGVLVSFWRDGKEMRMDSLSYKAYVRIWVFLNPLICLIRYTKNICTKLLRCLTKRK